jgi:nucleotide-binding universal stress UspA family protein
MERFKNILFVSCGGKNDMAALARANRLALSNQARITLVRVVEGLPLAASYFLSSKRITELQKASATLAGNELKRLQRHFDGSLQVTTQVLTGKPFIELIRAVNAASHDLIIKPKQTTGEDPTLGSDDLHLLRKCPCPIWIINPTQRKPFGKILIAVDPDPSDPERLRLHADLVKLGTSLARNEHGKVEVVHAWRVYGETMLRGPRFKLSDVEINALTDNEKATRQQWLDALVAPYADSNIKVTLVKGQPEVVLTEIIEKKKPDVVVIGTVARSGLPALLIGNTAEYVLSRINSSILTVKPRGFKSPVF